MKLKFVFFLYVTYSLLFSLCMSLFVSHCIYHGFLLFYMCMCHCFTLISLSISHYYLFFLSEFIVSWCFFLYMSLFILFSLCICHCSFTFLGMCHFLVFFYRCMCHLCVVILLCISYCFVCCDLYLCICCICVSTRCFMSICCIFVWFCDGIVRLSLYSW